MKKQEIFTLDLGGRTAPLRVRRNARARNIILRIDGELGGAVLTLPKGASMSEGLAMAQRKSAWIGKHLDALPERVPFVDGGMVPFLGTPHRIIHRTGSRLVTCLDGDIFVGGQLDHLSRRLTDWMKKEAKCRIIPYAEEFTARLGRKVGRITIRDTRSRWGSCSAQGNMNFCWRLVMAPESVLAYVVAHEVAHFKHMNHRPDFWHTVEDLAKDLPQAPKVSRAWLKKNGEELRRYGQNKC